MVRLRKDILAAIFISFVFFIVGLVTISDYGINWDEPTHFTRGYAYLDFFLSGGKASSDLSALARRSIYHDQKIRADFWFKNDSGHPPFNGILFAASNKIFYETLGILPDIEAYSLTGIVLGAVFLYFFVRFATERFGAIAGIIAGLSLAMYPLFFGEVHFNVKDPPEMIFFSATVMLLYLAATKVSLIHTLLAGLTFGLALATKFNAIFLPLIFLPWFGTYIWQHRSALRGLPAKKKLLLFFLFPTVLVVGLVILFVSWPYLWRDFPGHILKILAFYRTIGTVENYQPSYLFYGFNLYPLIWIIMTTPIIVLVLSAAGLVYALRCTKRDSSSLCALLMLWFLVPVLRVTIPGTSIYGGVRQIMEFLPAIALLSGIGGSVLLRMFQKRWRYAGMIVFVGLAFVLHGLELTSYHPNESIFFNSLTGGLKGAYDKQIPAAGEDLGNVFRQGVNWLNQHAEKKAKITFIMHGASALPWIWLRPDLVFSEEWWSGFEQKGEYITETTSAGWTDVFYFKSLYAERFLDPVYVLRVRGAPVLKIWKNSPANVRPGFRRQKMTEAKPIQEGRSLFILLPEIVPLTKLELEYGDRDCQPLQEISIAVSSDKITWYDPYSPIVTYDDGGKAFTISEGKITRLFPADQAAVIRLRAQTDDSCPIKNARKAIVWFLDENAKNNE